MDKTKNEGAKIPTPKTNPLTEAAALAQWGLLEDEYCIEPEPEGVIKGVKRTILHAIQKGRMEVCEDPTEGIIVRQFLRRSPLQSGEKALTYRAPDASHIAATGIGKEEERTNVMRWVKLTAAITGIDEGAVTRLKGGDRALMETIAQLFLFA